MAIGGISKTFERLEVVDFSWPYFEESLALASHVPQLKPKWQAIFWPFDFLTWIGLASVLVVFALIFATLFLIDDRLFLNSDYIFSLDVLKPLVFTWLFFCTMISFGNQKNL